MKLKTILLLGLLTAGRVYAQSPSPLKTLNLSDSAPHFGVSLKYNAEYARYEVYAQANFTRDRFILGPSQISIAVPKQVADQPLDIYSETARWTDYSSVYAPSSASDVDFHGIHSLGKSVDFQANQPFMLFSFSLKGGYVDGVRLYVNGQDPGSAKPGMMGGDFSNTIQDHISKEFYHGAFNQTALAQLTNEVSSEGMPTVSVYPNPITGNTFSVTTQQFTPGERLRLRILSASGVELYGFEEETSKLVNYQVKLPKELSGQAYLYTERTVPSTVTVAGQRAFCKKLIILN